MAVEDKTTLYWTFVAPICKRDNRPIFGVLDVTLAL